MAKIYAQVFPEVWEQSTASLATSGSIGSGSFPCHGYAQIVGGGICSGSGGNDAASNLLIQQTIDGGTNWDIVTGCGLSACTSASFFVDVIGEFAKVIYYADTTESTDEFRTRWVLKPVE